MTDGTVSETGSLGEASATCGAGHGDGIAPGAVSRLTVTLRPGRYELACNLPGHYATGMHTGLEVRCRDCGRTRPSSPGRSFR